MSKLSALVLDLTASSRNGMNGAMITNNEQAPGQLSFDDTFDVGSYSGR